MKISIIVFALLAIGMTEVHAQNSPTTATGQTTPAPTDYQVVQQDGNSRVWQRETYEQGPNGEVITNLQNYTELATGLNHLVVSQWIASGEDVEIQPDGTFQATNGQHQVYFPLDIYNGEIKLVTPNNTILKSQPVGLSYDDGSNTVLIAVLTNSIGQIINTNQVIYANAFSGIDADLIYSYTRAGLEQDIVIRTCPSMPAAMGLNADSARLQVLTEFFNPPQPGETVSTLPEQAGMALTDDTLDFGQMEIIQGKAFMIGQNLPAASVGKSWVNVQGRQLLVEAVPLAALTNELETLPQPATQTASALKLRMASRKLVLPAQHLAKANGRTLKLAKAAVKRKPGVVLDYITVNSSITNTTFQGDTTYYISGMTYSYGTNIFEGGTVIKYASSGEIYIEPRSGTTPSVTFKTSAYRPVVFTAKDDNSVGNAISGSTGTPSGYYGTMLYCDGIPTPTLSDFRMSYASTGITCYNNNVNLYDAQLVNCQNGISLFFTTAWLENALFADTENNIVASDYSTINVQNTTFNDATSLVVGPDSPYFDCIVTITNCILSNESALTNGYVTLSGAYNGFYNSPVFGTGQITNIFNPFQTVGAGSYYLTNGCAFHNAGTTNINAETLAGIQTRTTYPPLIYSNVVISVPTTLAPQAQRDNTGSPDLGYHYDPLDYIVGGCDLSANLTFNPGTAVGWFYSDEPLSGIACALLLNSGANLTFSGTATSPDWMARFTTVQEGENGAWFLTSSQPGLELNGNGTGATPQLNAQFSKWSVLASDAGHFQDNRALGNVNISDSEFYIANIVTYKMSSLYFTNCLFYRAPLFFYDSEAAPILTINDSTFYDGILVGSRTSGQDQFWTIENTTFDGTGFFFTDYYNGNSSYTLFNYNTYNTNNLSGLTIPFPYGTTTNILEVNGPNTLQVTNYNWQSSWFGNFYLPTNSPLIEKGSTTANFLGLYHFTTQTNQTVEGDSQVDIGYHYVATGTNGLPLDTNGDGIPDYIEDANGNGLVDSGEIGWNLTNDLGLQVIISQPRNGSNLP